VQRHHHPGGDEFPIKRAARFGDFDALARQTLIEEGGGGFG